MARNSTGTRENGLLRPGWWMTLVGAAAFAVAGCGQVGSSGAPGSGTTPPNGATTTPPASTPAEASPTPTQAASVSGDQLPRLVVLGGARGGAHGLWTYDTRKGWTKPTADTPMTALGRDESAVLLAGPAAIETRALGAFASGGERAALAVTPKSVASIARSASGRVALVMLDDSGPGFAVGTTAGGFESLSPAPSQPFSPLVAWLPDGRLLALSTDSRQVSRLCAIDDTKGELSLLTGLGGVRVFAASPDGATIAAATEEGVYVGPTAAWLSNQVPDRIFPVADDQVVWDLALDASGRRLALLVGDVAADGSVSNVREVAYAQEASAWLRVLDVGVPFEDAAGQIWLD